MRYSVLSLASGPCLFGLFVACEDPVVPAVPTRQADLMVRDDTLAPATPTAGETVTFTADVLNQGAASAGGSSSTRLHIDGDPVPPDATTGDLEPGASESATWSWTASEGDHTYQICADDDGAGGVIEESDEANNCSDPVPFHIGPTPLPDLVIQDETFSPATPTAGETVTFTADVLNQGAASAGGSSSTRLHIDGDPVPPDAATGDLEPGASESATWSWTASEGDHTYQICADDDGAGGVIEESDEANNCSDPVPFSVPTLTGTVSVGATGSQTPTLHIPSSGEHVGGAFTLVRDDGSTTITQITFTETGTVTANTNLSELDIYYEAAAACSFDGDELLFGSATSFDLSEKAVVSGSMTVATAQICVYASVTIGDGAFDGETLEIEISDPSSEVVAGSGLVSPAIPVEIPGTTTLSTAPPPPPTYEILDVVFDWDTYQQRASGSDNWPLTWCEDGHQYTSWGDGGGFGGTNQDGRVSLGFARLEGDYPDFVGYNVWGGKNPENPATFAGKSTSMLCLNGYLYAWRSSGGSTSALKWKQIIRSVDKAATWEEDVFPDSRLVGDAPGRPGIAYFIDFGQNYLANTDGYVYVYSIRIENPDVWDVQKPGIIWLARAPAAGEEFTDLANWEWVTALDASHNPTWGSMEDRVPVLEDPDGMMRNSAIYIPPLNRYVMVTNHTARNQGNIAIWEAPEPWGPWNLVMKEWGWPSAETDAVSATFAFGNFSPKWFSADGHDFVFVWFRPDAWNSVAGRFITTGG